MKKSWVLGAARVCLLRRRNIYLVALLVTPTVAAVHITWNGDNFASSANAYASISEPPKLVEDSFVGSNTPFADYNQTGSAEARVDAFPMAIDTATGVSTTSQSSGRLENVFSNRLGFFFVGGSQAFIASIHSNDTSVINTGAAAISSRIFEFQVDTPSRALLSGTLDILEYNKASPDDNLFQNAVNFSLSDTGSPESPLLYRELTGTNNGVSSLVINDNAYLLPGTTYSFLSFSSAGTYSNVSNDYQETVVTSVELYLDIFPVPLPSTLALFAAGLAGLGFFGGRGRVLSS